MTVLATSERRLRLLFMTPFAPSADASHGGRVTGELIRRLAKRHEVALVGIRGEEEAPAAGCLGDVCKLVEEVVRPQTRPPGRWRNRLRQLSKLVGVPPSLVQHADVTGYAEKLGSVASTFQPDIVQIEMTEMAQYLPALSGCSARRVLVDHDPGLGAAFDFSLAAGDDRLRRFWRLLDAHAWKRYVRALGEQVDAIVVFTDRDRRAVEQYAAGSPVLTIPFAARLPESPLNPRGEDPPILLYFGGFRHPPNANAALRLAQAIFPRVRALHPEVRLELVGTNPTPDMLQMSAEDVFVSGRVDSVVPYMERAALVVVPLRYGGGMRVKVLETLAAGKALVASSRAVEGLDLVSGRDFLLAESDEEFVAAISELLKDERRRTELARGARAWAEANLSWERVALEYEALYRKLLHAE